MASTDALSNVTKSLKKFADGFTTGQKAVVLVGMQAHYFAILPTDFQLKHCCRPMTPDWSMDSVLLTPSPHLQAHSKAMIGRIRWWPENQECSH